MVGGNGSPIFTITKNCIDPSGPVNEKRKQKKDLDLAKAVMNDDTLDVSLTYFFVKMCTIYSHLFYCSNLLHYPANLVLTYQV